MNFTILYRARRILFAYRDILKPTMRVLDVGCGNGVVGDMIAQELGVTVIGTDILGYVTTGLPFVPMPAEHALPFPDGSFDVAMFNDMLHHMPYENQVRLIREGLRVARAALIFEVKPTRYAQFTDWLMNKIHEPLMRISLTHRTRTEWEALFRGEGWEVASREVREAIGPKKKDAGWWISRAAYLPVTNYCLLVKKE